MNSSRFPRPNPPAMFDVISSKSLILPDYDFGAIDIQNAGLESLQYFSLNLCHGLC
jgi:hypothetical protein